MENGARILILLLLTLNLFSCVNFDAKKSLQVELPKEWQEKIKNNSNPQKLEFGWWRKDKKLEEVVNKILSQNLSLKQAYFRLAAAREDGVSQAYLPKLDLNNTLNFNKVLSGATNNFFLLNNPTKPNSYYKSSLDASWELPLFGQFDAASKAYKADTSYAIADIKLIKTSLISEAIRVYSQMRLEQNRISEISKITISQQKIFNYIEVRFEAGFANKIELSQAKQEILLLENEMLQAKVNLTSYQRQLTKLMGDTSFDQTLADLEKIPEFDFQNFDNAPADVIRNRPDIQKAEAEVLKALAGNIISRSELFPKITLSGSLTLSNNLINTPTLGRSLQVGAAPTISIPLFDFGQRLANDRIKRAQLYESSEKYKETIVSAINEVETNFSAYGQSIQQEKNLLESSKTSQEIFYQTIILHSSGIKDGIDLESAAINNSRSLINLWEARVNSISKLALLVKSLGGYYDGAAN